MDNLSSPDFLSDLPLGIIHVILSLLPIRDAVRTSFLSQKWRYVWSSLPHLAFDDKCVNPPITYGSDEKRLIHFISQALLLHEGPIHKFELRLPHMVNSQCINQWMLFLSRNGISILLLESDDEYEKGDFGNGFEIPSSLYSCRNLTNLKLHVHSIPPPPPSFKGFLFLKSLDIRIYDMNSITIGNIVSQSPLLEELTLDGIEDMKLTICSLNLKYLHLYPFDDLSLFTPLLEELTGDFEDMKSFSIGVDSLVFHHLRTIELSSVPFDVASAVIRLIMGSPNLQKLEISFLVSMRDDPPEVSCFWDMEPGPDITYNSLKLIKIVCFGGYIDEMKFIEFLLARSPVLETLMLYMQFPSIPDEKLLKLTTQLMWYRRASAKAQIVIC